MIARSVGRPCGAAVPQLRTEGFDIRDEDLAHLSPFVRHHINRFGSLAGLHVLLIMLSCAQGGQWGAAQPKARAPSQALRRLGRSSTVAVGALPGVWALHALPIAVVACLRSQSHIEISPPITMITLHLPLSAGGALFILHS